MVSRILGMVRVALIAYILGVSTRQADMFELANTVPNSIYILFAGGALNTVLVPQIVRAIKNDPDGGEAYTNRIMTAFMLIVTGVAVLVTALAPVVVAIYSSSKWRVPELAEQYSSLITLAYLTLPQIFFYGAFFLLGQVLNARDKFGPMMWAPIANNIISILLLVAYLAIWGNGQDTSQAFTLGQMLMLGLGSTFGIAVQTAVLIPFVRKAGFKLRPRFDIIHTGLGKTFKLAGWTLGFVAVNQVALVVVQRLATSATASGEGAGLLTYNNAHLLWILPHSLITVSLATAMLPNASRLAAAGDNTGLASEVTKTMRLALLVIVPAAVTFIALAGPISGILFGHGTNPDDAVLIAWTLMAFTVGLVPFTIQFVCLRTYYALEDTRTTFLLQILIAGINMLGAVVLVGLVSSTAWIAPALGLAYSLAYFVGVLVSWRLLRSRIPGLDGGKLVLHIVRLAIGSAVGGVGAYFLSRWLLVLIPNALVANLVSCAAGAVLILGGYLLVGRLLKVHELANLRDLVRTRFGRGKASASSAAVATPDLADEPETVLLPAADDTPTVVSDALDDIGPITIVRNRPPASLHTFDDGEEESIIDSVFRKPAMESGSADGADPGDGAAGPDEADEDSGDPADQPTGPLDLEGLFRDEEPAAQLDGIANVGTLINTRYELLELLASRHGTETWRAHDQVLSRDVIVHVIAAGDARIGELMTAARKGAVATDSRFLRVLDADELTGPAQPIGAYVVAEYAHGRSLTRLLTAGPLSGIEAAFIVRELADALVGVHSQGLFHEAINPDNVIITSSGAVRLVGFGIEATLAGRGDGGSAWALREASDVVGLGNLLYACLVQRWPGEPGFGLTAAPVIAGEAAPPHTIRAGISPALDRICSVTLTRRGAASERRITTVSQLVDALNQVLGTADASADLEQRVRASDSKAIAPAPSVTREEAAEPVSAATRTEPRQSYEPIAGSERTGRSRRVLGILVALAVLALVVSLIIVGVNNSRDNAAQPSDPGVSASADQSAATSPIQIVGATDFDPETDGGNGEEHPERVDAVFDGDPSTSWVTMSYRSRPDLGGLKPGVGVILDLGEEKTVTAAELTLTGGPTGIELRVPTGAEPSMRTQADWKVVGADDSADATVTIPLTEPVQTRYLMVYFTMLPQVGDSYIGELNEVVLR